MDCVFDALFLATLPDNAKLKIFTGFVFDEFSDWSCSFESYFKKWRKAQEAWSLAGEDNRGLPEVLAALKAAEASLHEMTIRCTDAEAKLAATESRLRELEYIKNEYFKEQWSSKRVASNPGGCMSDADDQIPMPKPLCTYADHSYPAYTREQMIYAAKRILDLEAENAELKAKFAAWEAQEPAICCRAADIKMIDENGAQLYVFNGKRPFADWVNLYTQPKPAALEAQDPDGDGAS